MNEVLNKCILVAVFVGVLMQSAHQPSSVIEDLPAKEFLYFQLSFEQMPLPSSWCRIPSEILTKHYEECTSIVSLTLGKLPCIIIFIITFSLWKMRKNSES